MDAIFNVPPQVQYSASLLHLGKMYFCYVRTGMPPHPDPNFGNGFVTGNDKKRFINIVIFQAVRETYKKNGTRFSKANFLHSEHYEVNTPFPNRGFIKGCYVLGSVYFSCLLFVSSLLFFFFSYLHTIRMLQLFLKTMLDLSLSTHDHFESQHPFSS